MLDACAAEDAIALSRYEVAFLVVRNGYPVQAVPGLWYCTLSDVRAQPPTKALILRDCVGIYLKTGF